MTTAYNDIRLSSQDVTALMRRINALEAACGYVYGWQFGSSGTGDGEFGEPNGIAIASDGSIFVADKTNNRVQKFDADGNYVSEFGSFGTGDGEFNHPRGIAVDSSDNIYVADANNDRIQKFDSSGAYLLQWGTTGSGDTNFDAPNDVLIDSSNMVYVSDEGPVYGKLRKFNAGGTHQVTFDQRSTATGYDISGLSLGPSGYIYAVDSRQKVIKFTTGGAYQSEFDVPSYSYDIAYLDERIYVGNNSPSPADADQEIKVYDTAGTLLGAFGGYGTGDGQFFAPFRLFLYEGNLYISDGANDRVQVFHPYTQTEFFAYLPAPDSLGTPDGGVAVPSLTGLLGSKVAGQVMIDMQTAIEALAPYFINVDSGDPFNWTDLDSVDNLYYKAVDLADYGGAGHDFIWRRSLVEMIDAFPTEQDIGELDDCVTLLEASALA